MSSLHASARRGDDDVSDEYSGTLAHAASEAAAKMTLQMVDKKWFGRPWLRGGRMALCSCMTPSVEMQSACVEKAGGGGGGGGARADIHGAQLGLETMRETVPTSVGSLPFCGSIGSGKLLGGCP